MLCVPVTRFDGYDISGAAPWYVKCIQNGHDLFAPSQETGVFLSKAASQVDAPDEKEGDLGSVLEEDTAMVRLPQPFAALLAYCVKTLLSLSGPRECQYVR